MNGSNTRNGLRPHAWEREQIKIIFQYSLMLLAALVAGWLLPRFFSESVWQKAYQMVDFHFSPTDSHQIWKTVYVFAKPTLFCIAAVFVFSFSSLNCLVTDGVLVYLGARTGCALSVLYTMFQNVTSPPSAFDCFLFVLFRLLVLAIFFVFSVHMAKYSYRLRIYSQEGRTLFHPQTVLGLIVHTVLCGAMCFALHFLYGYSMYLVSK